MREPLAWLSADGPLLQRGSHRVADVEWLAAPPGCVGLESGLPLEAAPLQDRARQGQGHLRVVGGLARERVPGPTVGELPWTLGVEARDPGRRLELDQAPEAVARELAQEAALRTRQEARIANGRSWP